MALPGLSPREAAQRLGIHVDTLNRWADAGSVPVWRTPGGWRRFTAEDIEALAEQMGRSEAS